MIIKACEVLSGKPNTVLLQSKRKHVCEVESNLSTSEIQDKLKDGYSGVEEKMPIPFNQDQAVHARRTDPLPALKGSTELSRVEAS